MEKPLTDEQLESIYKEIAAALNQHIVGSKADLGEALYWGFENESEPYRQARLAVARAAAAAVALQIGYSATGDQAGIIPPA